jgi:hypothetical protein
MHPQKIRTAACSRPTKKPWGGEAQNQVDCDARPRQCLGAVGGCGGGGSCYRDRVDCGLLQGLNTTVLGFATVFGYAQGLGTLQCLGMLHGLGTLQCLGMLQCLGTSTSCESARAGVTWLSGTAHQRRHCNMTLIRFRTRRNLAGCEAAEALLQPALNHITLAAGIRDSCDVWAHAPVGCHWLSRREMQWFANFPWCASCQVHTRMLLLRLAA